MTAMTGTGIVTKAYQDAQVLAKEASLSAAQQADGMDRLNDILNFLQTQGMKLFLDLEQAVTLVLDQQKYSLMPGGDVSIAKPLEVKQASYWDASDNSRDVDVISRQEWSMLSNRTASGSVNQVYAETLYDRINLYVWNIPDTTAATGTLKLVLRTQVTDLTAIGDTLLLPPEWALPLRWMLAEELSTGMPESVQNRCKRNAAMYKVALEDWDVENTETTFQPDTRYSTGSRFR